MTTIKILFRAPAHGAAEGALYYRVTHNRMVRQLHTGRRLYAGEWDSLSGRVIPCGDDSRMAYLIDTQERLDDDLARLSGIVADLDKGGYCYTVADVVERFLGSSPVVGFLSFSHGHIAGLRRKGCERKAEHYATALNSFTRFCGGADVPFRDFSDSLIRRYESAMRGEGLVPNTISYYMRNLRAIYNHAVEAGLAVQSDPFRHVYTGIARTVKRAVALPVVRLLRDLDLGGDPWAELARDVFMFSFYTRGMAIVDVAYLRKSDLRDGTLTYCRRKTGRLLSIRWEPPMQEIVDRHATPGSDFLLPLIGTGGDHRRQFLTTYSRLLRRLRKIGEGLGLTEPLTFHRSRHAWATIAREHNVPLSVISEGMGHDSEKTTRIYLASLDTSAVDKANSDILKLLTLDN